jgi:hypothetical protein
MGVYSYRYIEIDIAKSIFGVFFLMVAVISKDKSQINIYISLEYK